MQSCGKQVAQLKGMITVTRCGRICVGSREISFCAVFAGQVVGIREVDDNIWLSGRPYPSFLGYDLDYFDEEEARVEPTTNPFLPEL